MSCPDLTTERLLLRQWRAEDAAGALHVYGDEAITRWLSMEPIRDTAEMERWFDRIAERVQRYAPGFGGWGVFERGSGRVVGGALLKNLPDADDVPTPHIEIGWHLAQHSWGKGYATEAAREILRYGFEDMDLEVIHALTEPDNTPSQKVCSRLCMEDRGSTEQWYGMEARWFALGRETWRQG